MAKQLGPKTAIVTLKELGTNCWLPMRFIDDASRCDRVFTCKYPEKHNCKAIVAELTYLKNEKVKLMNTSIQIDRTMDNLSEMLEK